MFRRTTAAVIMLFATVSLPWRAQAASTKTHSLPSGSSSTTVFTFGASGGNLRPWSLTITLGGSVAATGISAPRSTLTDPANTLAALITLADAENFFHLKKAVACSSGLPNPDAGQRFMAIHTNHGTHRVIAGGSCAATAGFDRMFDVVSQVAGVS